MMILVTGGSKCGKSRFAESLFKDRTEQKYYIATMKPYGDEAFSAIEHHHKMRADKGFLTIEQYTDIDSVSVEDGSAILLECMGNLLANEMFNANQIIDCTDKIITNIIHISCKSKLLVIVTNQVCSDGLQYEKGTAEYIASLGKINQKIAAYADEVFECIYGIPVKIKG